VARLPAVLFPAQAWIFFCACTAAPAKESRPIPMRLAVMPITSIGDRERVNVEDLDGTDMVLSRDGRRFARAVVDALDRKLFAQAFLLEPGTPPAEGAPPIDWAALAEQQGADALLSLELACNPAVMEASNSSYYLNFLLFAIGGPFCWWLSDHTYDVEAKLSAELYDIPRLRRENAAPGSESSGVARISDAAAPSERLEMSFTDRADGNAGQYALSVVWPAPLLMEDNEDVRETIETQVIRALAERLAADMRADREFILVAPFLAPFHVDVDSARAYSDAGGVHLRAEVLVMADSRVENVDSVQIRIEKELFTAPTREAEPRSVASRKYRVLNVAWDHAPGAEFATALQLVVEAETPGLVTRTYTIPIESDKAAGPR
jgi:hypothetical protein